MAHRVSPDGLRTLSAILRDRTGDPTVTVTGATLAPDGTFSGCFRSCRFHEPDQEAARFHVTPDDRVLVDDRHGSARPQPFVGS